MESKLRGERGGGAKTKSHASPQQPQNWGPYGGYSAPSKIHLGPMGARLCATKNDTVELARPARGQDANYCDCSVATRRLGKKKGGGREEKKHAATGCAPVVLLVVQPHLEKNGWVAQENWRRQSTRGVRGIIDLLTYPPTHLLTYPR